MVPQDNNPLNFRLFREIQSTPVPPDWEARSSTDPGFCYLVLFPHEQHREIAYVVGPYPTWGRLKSLGADNARGAYHLERRRGYVHVTTGGSGYSIRDLGIRDDEVVGGFPVGTTPLYTMNLWFLVICYMLLLTCVEGRRRLRVSAVANHLSEKYPGLVFPDNFEKVYTKYLDKHDPGLPPEYMCVEDQTIRNEVLDLDWEDEPIMDFIYAMCPPAAKERVTFLQLDLFLTRQTVNKKVAPSSPGEAVDAVINTFVSDASDVAAIAPDLHAKAKHVTEKAVRLTGERVSRVADQTLDITATVSELMIENGKTAVDEAVRVANEAAAVTIDQTSQFANEMVVASEEQSTKARAAVKSTINTGSALVWDTIGTTNNIISNNVHVPGRMIERAAELGSEVMNTIENPAEIVRNFKKDQHSLAEYGEILGESVAKMSTDTIKSTQTVYASGENLAKSIYDSSYSSDEIANGIMTPMKELAEGAVPMVKQFSNGVLYHWRDYLREGRETAAEAVANAPWVTEHVGKSTAGFINGFTKELGIKELPNWMGNTRDRLIGKPEPRRHKKEPWWTLSWVGNRQIGIVNNGGDESWVTTFVTIFIAVGLSVAVVLITDRHR